MRSFLDIVKSRSNPGILIFDTNNRLVYSNRAALEYFPGLRRGKVSPEILDLCLRQRGQRRPRSLQKEGAQCLVIDSISGLPFSLRGFLLTERRQGKAMNFVMILVEKIIDRHMAEIDFDKIRHDYGLSKREREVLELISQGLSNLEISRKLFISEYTVKDHIKKVLSKMKLGSRSEIIASLLQPRR